MKKLDQESLTSMATEVVDVLKKWPISYRAAIEVLHEAERQIGEIKININLSAQDTNT